MIDIFACERQLNNAYRSRDGHLTKRTLDHYEIDQERLLTKENYGEDLFSLIHLNRALLPAAHSYEWYRKYLTFKQLHWV